MKAIVVTGVSSGIGLAIAELGIAKGMHVFGGVRTPENAEKLGSRFPNRFTPLLFDVRDERAIRAAADQTKQALAGETLFGLVNNAGAGLTGPLLNQPLDEIRAVLDTNILGAILVTRAFAPLLIAEAESGARPGRIVNMSSIAGKIAQPFAAAYVTSKHAIEGLSDAMRRELHLFGIDVAIVAPAAVKTPIWDRPEASIGRYSDTPFGPAFDKGVRSVVDSARKDGLEPSEVAKTVYRALTSAHPRLRYAPAKHALVEQILPRVTPDRVIDLVVSRSLGLNPENESSSGNKP